MKSKRKIASAKALVFDPLFRPRQEKARKGKGSYARRPRNRHDDSGPSLLRDPRGAARAGHVGRKSASGPAFDPCMTLVA